MCRRLDQNDIDRLLNDFGGAEEIVRRSHAELLFNAAPGTMRPILRMEYGKLVIDDLWWMYKASGTPATVRPTPNERLDKIAGRYWGRLLNAGRIVVLAKKWYVWTGSKLPFHCLGLVTFAWHFISPALHTTKSAVIRPFI